MASTAVLRIVPDHTGEIAPKQVRRPPANEATRFKPGQSGNPAGRPKGARCKLGEEFYGDLLESWQQGGKRALEVVRDQFPVEYVKLCASLLPKDAGLSDGRDPDMVLQVMSDEQLAATMDMLQRLVALEELIASGAIPDPLKT